MYYFIQRRVQNKAQYLYQFLSFPRLLVPLVNIYLWSRLIETHNPLKTTQFVILSLTNQAYMGLYPLLHNHILDQINKDRHPIIVARNTREHNH